MKTVSRLLARISIEHLWAITVIVAIFAFVDTHPIRPHDFWWHIAIGRDILSSRQIPAVDIYSFTMPGQPYPSYTMFWLMEVVLYEVYKIGGPVLIILMQALLITPAYFLVLLSGWRLSQNWRAAAFGTLFAAALGFGNWNVRPQSVTYLYGALILWSVIEFRRTRKLGWLAIPPVVMVFWVNSHGSFPIGLVILGCWLADEAWEFIVKRLRRQSVSHSAWIIPAVTIAASLAACLINPRGMGIVAYLNMMAGNSVVQNYILEWMPPNFNSLEGIIFFAGFLSFAVLLAVSPRRPNFFQIISFCIFGVLGLKYIRGIVWFGLIMAPVAAVHLAAVLEKLGWGNQPVKATPATRRLNNLFLLALSIMAFFSLPWFKPLFPFTPEKTGLISAETPIQATDFLLENHLPTNIFHDMAFGSYLIWRAQPAYKVFVDSRVELYPMKIWDDYWKMTTADAQWEKLTLDYGINTLMLEPVKQVKLIEAAKVAPAWELVYQDSHAVIFIRKQVSRSAGN